MYETLGSVPSTKKHFKKNIDIIDLYVIQDSSLTKYMSSKVNYLSIW